MKGMAPTILVAFFPGATVMARRLPAGIAGNATVFSSKRPAITSPRTGFQRRFPLFASITFVSGDLLTFTFDLIIRNYRRKQATAGQTFTTLPGDNPGSAPPAGEGTLSIASMMVTLQVLRDLWRRGRAGPRSVTKVCTWLIWADAHRRGAAELWCCRPPGSRGAHWR